MYKIFLLISLLFLSNLHANTLSWRLLSQDYSKIISKNKTTHLVAQFPESIFISGARQGENAWREMFTQMQFEIKTNQYFVIIISVNTSLGVRELTYVSGEKETKTYLGLGLKSIDNRWHTITRNIEDDLQKLYPNHRLKSINAMVVKGRISIRNIKFKKSLIKALKTSKVSKPFTLRPKKIVAYKKHNRAPKIFLKKNSIVHPLGKEFIVPNIKAVDIYGNILEPEVVGYVDSKKEGKYVLNYIVTDQAGNVATQRQVVLVKNVKNQNFQDSKNFENTIETFDENAIEIEGEELSPPSPQMDNENVSEVIMTDEMILENEYLQELISSDFNQEG